MKKLCSLLLVMVLLLGLSIPAAASDPLAQAWMVIGGDWYLSSVNYGGTVMSPADLNMEMSLTINADGTAVSTLMGEVHQGAWRAEGDTIVIGDENGEEVLLAMGEGTLTTVDEESGITMVFTREAAPAVEPILSPAKEPAAEAVWALSSEEFSGEWIAATLVSGEESAPVESQPEAWPLLFGTQDTTLLIEGTRVTMFGGEPEEFALENGRLQLIQPRIIGVPEGLLDKTVTLFSDDTLALTVMNMTILCRRAPMDLSGYTGQWYGIYLDTPVMKGNPQTMWSLNITLELAEDGSGRMDYLGLDSGKRWFEADGEVWYGDDNAATALLLTEDGLLRYGDEGSGYILFARDPSVRWKNDLSPAAAAEPTPEPTAEPAPAAEPAPEPAESTEASLSTPRPDVFYRCVRVTSGGYSFDPSDLGGPTTLTLLADGTASFYLGGEELPNLTWRLDEAAGRMAIDYYDDQVIYLTPLEDGFELADPSSGMTLFFLPQ